MGVALPSVFTVVGFYLAFNGFWTGVFCTMLVFIISLIIVVLCLLQDIKNLKQEQKELKEQFRKEKEEIMKKLDEVEKRHAAVSNQFKMKQEKLENVKKCWHFLGFLFISTMQNSRKDRFETAYKTYLNLTQSINISEEE